MRMAAGTASSLSESDLPDGRKPAHTNVTSTRASRLKTLLEKSDFVSRFNMVDMFKSRARK
jgi:hypothetical protein